MSWLILNCVERCETGYKVRNRARVAVIAGYIAEKIMGELQCAGRCQINVSSL